jgi:3-deoxy-D-manno-octulosonate 8-phosphate phosphatase (KDO 8-P phosphatase)
MSLIPTPHTTPSLDIAAAMERARKIAWMFFDVDGVMTDGGLVYGAEGEMLKRFHVQDGHGLKSLRAAGIRIGMLSGRQHDAVAFRARELGFDLVVQGESRKGAAFDRIVQEMGIDPQACGHLGDDTPDIEVFDRVCFAAAVANATPDVLARAHWISQRRGGDGAVRECCDFILASRA